MQALSVYSMLLLLGAPVLPSVSVYYPMGQRNVETPQNSGCASN